jgi:hypothetical protein
MSRAALRTGDGVDTVCTPTSTQTEVCGLTANDSRSFRPATSGVIESEYDWLAEGALPRATTLIWLDFQWTFAVPDCSHVVHAEEATVRDAKETLQWAETYWNRQTSNSFVTRECLTILRTKFSLATNSDSVSDAMTWKQIIMGRQNVDQASLL